MLLLHCEDDESSPSSRRNRVCWCQIFYVIFYVQDIPETEGVAKRTLLECFSRYFADKTRPDESSKL
jgi:hypothetical protein